MLHKSDANKEQKQRILRNPNLSYGWKDRDLKSTRCRLVRAFADPRHPRVEGPGNVTRADIVSVGIL